MAKIAIIRCSEERCDDPIRQALRRMGLGDGDYITISVPGASLSIKTLEEWIGNAIAAGIRTIFLIDHLDCKWYIKVLGYQYRETPAMILKNARLWLKERFPKLRVCLFRMPTDGRGGIQPTLEEID